ncbi:hypothetical protein [Methylobacterium sp. C1]|uniref:hypothetical protein n=1 Tax=Methylobacterium sp. C1 TaxID=1479019 RepID=UPI0013311C75|nr:hypothetical protein [Methylobacterium sp. C1]
MSDGANTSRKKSSRRSDAQAAQRFVEELSWLLTSYSGLDFKALQDLSVQKENPPESLQKFAPKNPNVVYLVGTLPGLFMDEKLFPSNEDIAEFSSLALKINIPRWQKKAKFELVGHIVCHAVSLNDKQVAHLTRALTRIVDGEVDARKLIEDRKEAGMSWNVVIQNLLLR